MNFNFDYNIAGTVTTIGVTIEDHILAEAAKLGVDAKAIEGEVKVALDNFVQKVTSTSFWSRVSNTVHKVEEEVKTFVSDLLDEPQPTPPAPPAPPVGPSDPNAPTT